MAKVARDNNTLLIIPNAGADEITGPLVRGQRVSGRRSRIPSSASQWAR
jgi:hypothetical protein